MVILLLIVTLHYQQLHSSLAELDRIELKPFKNAMENDVKMIMTGHIAMPALDEFKETSKPFL